MKTNLIRFKVEARSNAGEGGLFEKEFSCLNTTDAIGEMKHYLQRFCNFSHDALNFTQFKVTPILPLTRSYRTGELEMEY